MNDAQAFIAGGGVKSAKFENVGDKVSGVIEEMTLQQQRDINDGTPLTWPDGNPRMQVKIVLQTDDHEDDDDDGKRAIYVRGQMQKAVREAVKAAGANTIEEGGTLAIQFYELGQASKRGFNPPKLYRAQYKAGRAAVSVDDLI